MSNELLYQVAAFTYAKMGGLNRDAMKVCASALLRNPDKIGDVEPNDRLEYTMTQKFPTKDEENKFKESLSLVSALMRGTEKILEVDEYYTKAQITKKSKEDKKYFNSVKPQKRVGRYHTYTKNP